MKLCGEAVKHRSFGRGTIVNFENNYLTVLFEGNEEEKKFAYPVAFGVFLELENKILLKQIEEEKNIIAQKEAEERKLREQTNQVLSIQLKKDNKSSLKRSSIKAAERNNIAFKCNYSDGGSSRENVGYKGVCSDETIKYNINVAKHVWCSQPENMCSKYLKGEVTRKEICEFYNTTKTEFSKSVCYESQMLEIWKAGAGITHNGDDKGKPMTLRNVTANSLALLTTRLPYADDEDRFIFAVFLVDESYEGDNREEGFVGANPRYRIQLSHEEAIKLKFWDYYYNPKKPEKIIFGSGLHRYLTDIQSAQVLREITKIKKGTPQESFSREFFEHYCKIKGLEINNVPKTEGALKREIVEIV